MFLVYLILVLIMSSDAYKPVLLFHGLLADGDSLHKVASIIQQEHPGTKVSVLDVYPNLYSTNPLWCQVKRMKREVEAACRNSQDGIHVIGYSQGGIIARGIIQSLEHHNVDTFISLSSPQMGIFGGPIPTVLSGLNNVMIRSIYRIFYSRFGQLISVSGFWKDPFHLNLYHKHSRFLPFLNNEINHTQNAEFKKGFTRLKKLVLIGSPNDGTIIPWQSSQFGFYKEKSEVVVEMKDQQIYKKDSFGLRTLDERGAVTLVTVPNVTHDDWIFNEDVIKRYIVPWVT